MSEQAQKEQQHQQMLRQSEDMSQARKRGIMDKFTKRWAAEATREQPNLSGGQR